MFFVRRNASYINLAGQSFRDLLQGRLEGLQATLGDWELHQSTAFPDVRLKKYIETRTSDAGPPDLLLALPALWKAVFYDDTARQRAHALADISSAVEATEMAHVAAVHGLQGSFHGRSLRTLAEELVELAQNSLERQAVRDGHRSEARWLQALRQPNGELRDRAAEVRQAFVDAQGDPRSFLTTATIDDAVAWLEQTRTTPDAPSTISAVSRV
jgi:glutamate--cysteine ligase